MVKILADVNLSTSTDDLTVGGTIELGHATDTTLSRSAAGTLAVEGVDVVTTSGAQTLTNKTLTGPVIDNPTLTTPAIGAATATSVNKVSITAPATSATITIANGKTFTAGNTLTLTGTDASSVAFGAGGTVLYSGGALGTPSSGVLTNATGLPISTGVAGLGTGVATFLATPSSANLAAAVTGETGTGALVFGTSPTIATPTLTGTITGNGATTDLVHGITLQRTTTLTVNASTDASATAIAWSSAVKNTTLYAYWSSGSDITIPLTGWYNITCHLASGTGNGTGFAFRLYALVNGTVVAKSEAQAGANTVTDTMTIATIQYLTAADSLVFRASASTTTKTVGGARFSGCSVVYMGNMSA